MVAVGGLPIFGGTLVQFRTVFGDVEVELMNDTRPITSSNFLHYVNTGAYRDCFFHRQQTNFVIQGGGFKVANIGTPQAAYAAIPVGAPIPNEFAVGPMIRNTRGTIAMAKTRNPNSATSQFFFNLVDNPGLDNPANSGGFTVFGRVVGGANAFALFNSFAYRRGVGVPLTNLVVNNGSSPFPFAELPVTLLWVNANQDYEVRFQDLVYVDITTLQVAVESRDGNREISWNGVPGATNALEFTATFPPVWQTLTNVVRPTAARPIVVDPSGDARRFYRVRADFPGTIP